MITFYFIISCLLFIGKAQVQFKKSIFLTPTSSDSPSFLVLHNINSVNVNGIELTDSVNGLAIDNMSLTLRQATPSISLSPSIVNQNSLQYTFTASTNLNDTVNLQYYAHISDINAFPENQDIYLTASLACKSTPCSGVSASSSVCVQRKNNIITKSQPIYGLAALTVFIGLFAGVAFALAILILLSFRCKFTSSDPATVSPYEDEENPVMRKVRRQLMMKKEDSEHFAKHSKNPSSAFETILVSLNEPSRMDRYRSIDSLDIIQSSSADVALEESFEQLSSDIVNILIHSLSIQGVFPQEPLDNCYKAYQTSLHDLNEKLKKKYDKIMKKQMKKCRKRNQIEMTNLLQQQKLSEETMTKQFGTDERVECKELVKIMKKQFDVEQNDLIYQLKMEQDIEMEKLRKEFALNRRATMSRCEVNYLSDLCAHCTLKEDQTIWLMNEYKRVNGRLHEMLDEHLAVQRGISDEKVERRKTLAELKSLEDDNERETIAILVGQQSNFLKRLRREGDITKEQTEFYLNQLKEDVKNVKESFEKQRQQQIQELHDILCERKKKQMQEKLEEQRRSVDRIRDDLLTRLTYTDTQQHQQQQQRRHHRKDRHYRGGGDDEDDEDDENSNGALDPVDYLTKWFKAYGKLCRVVADYENKLDEDHVNELIKVYNTVLLQSEDAIIEYKTKMLREISSDGGIRQDDVSRLLLQHSKEVQKLRKEIDEERKYQKENLAKRLLKRKRILQETVKLEQTEQMELRKRNRKNVELLMSTLSSVSTDEILKIQQEVTNVEINMEKSLTLEKLQQKRLYEQVFAERKQKSMQLLQQRLTKEKKQSKRSKHRHASVDKYGRRKKSKNHDDDDNDDDDDDNNNKNFSDQDQDQMISDKKLKQLLAERQQILDVTLGNDVDLEDDKTFQEIENRLLLFRANQLRAQEETLASFIVSLQVEKAQNESSLECIAESLNLLIFGSLSDLLDRGRLNEDKANRYVLEHVDQVKQLKKKVLSDDLKRNKSLTSKLEAIQSFRDDQANNEMAKEMAEKLASFSSQEKSKREIIKVLCSQNDLIDKETIRQRNYRENQQMLREAIRQQEMHSTQTIIDKRLEFLQGLQRLGKFSMSDFIFALDILLPHLSRLEIHERFIQPVIKTADKKETMKDSPQKKSLPPDPSRLPQFVHTVKILVMKLSLEKFSLTWSPTKTAIRRGSYSIMPDDFHSSSSRQRIQKSDDSPPSPPSPRSAFRGHPLDLASSSSIKKRPQTAGVQQHWDDMPVGKSGSTLREPNLNSYRSLDSSSLDKKRIQPTTTSWDDMPIGGKNLRDFSRTNNNNNSYDLDSSLIDKKRQQSTRWDDLSTGGGRGGSGGGSFRESSSRGGYHDDFGTSSMDKKRSQSTRWDDMPVGKGGSGFKEPSLSRSSYFDDSDMERNKHSQSSRWDDMPVGGKSSLKSVSPRDRQRMEESSSSPQLQRPNARQLPKLQLGSLKDHNNSDSFDKSTTSWDEPDRRNNKTNNRSRELLDVPNSVNNGGGYLSRSLDSPANYQRSNPPPPAYSAAKANRLSNTVGASGGGGGRKSGSVRPLARISDEDERFSNGSF